MLQSLLLFWLLSLVMPTTLHRKTVAPAEWPERTREEIMATAKRLQGHKWVCREKNRQAPCVKASPYKCDFAAADTITGIAYDWGGMDGPEDFDRKLMQGQAAGSHQRHGVTSCTTGIDCSGYVSYCWLGKRPAEKYGTVNIRDYLAVKPRANWFTDMKPGDGFNKPGSHIVLFAEYDATGKPVIYEASGPAGKVRRKVWRWSELQGYYAVQYKNVLEE